MPVTTVTKDPVALTMTVTAEFAATPERVWQLWADPRQLERWWGPPSYPATFVQLDLAPGGKAVYFMTGPDGQKTPYSSWNIVATDPYTSIVLRDQFADEAGTPDPEFPIIGMRVNIADIGGGMTRMSIHNEFPSAEALDKMLAMGMEEGMTQAVGQIDAMLAESARVPA
jgi:uncharacterized protein YndB with AHSA1/START domain